VKHSKPSLYKLALAPRPKRDELLSSWFTRLSWANGLSPRALTCQIYGDRPFDVRPRLDATDDDALIADLAFITDVSAADIRDMTLQATSVKVFGGLPTTHVFWHIPARRNGAHNAGCTVFCPQCLADPAMAYVPQTWRTAWCVVCPIHHCLMKDRCANCGAPFLPHMKITKGKYWLQRFDVCHACERPFTSVQEDMQVDADLIALVDRCSAAHHDYWAPLGQHQLAAPEWFARIRCLIEEQQLCKHRSLFGWQLGWRSFACLTIKRRLSTLRIGNSGLFQRGSMAIVLATLQYASYEFGFLYDWH
jgi:hypothetical protein